LHFGKTSITQDLGFDVLDYCEWDTCVMVVVDKELIELVSLQ
jgi:hypothetical protein